MLKFSETFEFSKEKFRKIPILKEFEWFERFEWFGPSPIEPFNSAGYGIISRNANDLPVHEEGDGSALLFNPDAEAVSDGQEFRLPTSRAVLALPIHVPPITTDPRVRVLPRLLRGCRRWSQRQADPEAPDPTRLKPLDHDLEDL